MTESAGRRAVGSFRRGNANVREVVLKESVFRAVDIAGFGCSSVICTGVAEDDEVLCGRIHFLHTLTPHPGCGVSVWIKWISLPEDVR